MYDSERSHEVAGDPGDTEPQDGRTAAILAFFQAADAACHRLDWTHDQAVAALRSYWEDWPG